MSYAALATTPSLTNRNLRVVMPSPAASGATSPWSDVVAPPRPSYDAVRALVARVYEFTRLPQGWDGPGSVPVTPPAAVIASRLVSTYYANLGEPKVGAIRQGGVLLEWECGELTIFFEVNPSGTVDQSVEQF